MGVIYQACDDVVELLIPFIVEKGGISDVAAIDKYYIEASLGNMTAADFWKVVGLGPGLEDEYLQRHALRAGLMAFLDKMNAAQRPVWCLSNDVSEWSAKLRRNLGIESYFEGFMISGDVRLRKPDPAIYRLLINRLNCRPGEITFVDDRTKNLDAAAAQGITTILFNCSAGPAGGHREARSFEELAKMLS